MRLSCWVLLSVGELRLLEKAYSAIAKKYSIFSILVAKYIFKTALYAEVDAGTLLDPPSLDSADLTILLLLNSDLHYWTGNMQMEFQSWAPNGDGYVGEERESE